MQDAVYIQRGIPRWQGTILAPCPKSPGLRLACRFLLPAAPFAVPAAIVAAVTSGRRASSQFWTLGILGGASPRFEPMVAPWQTPLAEVVGMQPLLAPNHVLAPVC